MPYSSRARWRSRVLSYGALSGALLASTGCATLRDTFGGYDTAPNGISRPQQRLREAMVASDYVAAMGWREDDALLRTLNAGIASYYAAQYARSGAVLDSAALLADDRITASVSRNAISLLTNDMARPYQPRRTERLFIPYYGMLAYARLGAWEDAAVEARRLSALLAQYANERDDDERSLHAALHHLAGAVFERAGNRGEAAVSYRAAHALAFALADSFAPSGSTREGELLVVVERGFVAHRTTESIDLYLDDSDRDSLRHSDASRQRTVFRIARDAGSWSGGGDIRQQAPGLQQLGGLSYISRRRHHDDDDDGRYLSIALPVLRRSVRQRGGAVHLTVDDRPMTDMRFVAMVDDASSADERRERVGVATRAIARAAAKFAVAKAITDRKGEAAGTIAQAGAALLERADTRSWHLLPQELTLVRVRLPVGVRRVRLRFGSDDDTCTVDAGSVTIVAGTLTIAPVRLWSDRPVPPRAAATERVVAASASACTSALCS
jgi:hypothetical protein